MITYTKHSLKKVESLFEELSYTIRYAKGNFQSGYAIVENQKIAVINKFYDTEGRINVLLEILDNIEIGDIQLSEASQKLLKQINKREKEPVEEEENNN